MRSQSLFLTLLISYLMTSCSPIAGSGAALTTATTTPSSSTVVTGSYPLALFLQGYWEGSTTYSSFTDVTSCVVPVGAASGTAVTCTISVPEATLHYSDIKFTLSTNSSTTCSQIAFRPYYFQRSTSAVFNPTGTGTSTIACDGSTLPLPADCYGGAAKSMVSSFPSSTGLYILPAVETTKSYTLKSSNSIGMTTTTDPTFSASNINVSNNNTNHALAYTGAVMPLSGAWLNYVTNSMVDYEVDCYDSYYEKLYSIVLTLKGTYGTTSSFWDWQ